MCRSYARTHSSVLPALYSTFVRYVGRVCAPIARTVGRGAVHVDTVFGSRAPTASFVIDRYSPSMIASGFPLSRLPVSLSVLSVIVPSERRPRTTVACPRLPPVFPFSHKLNVFPDIRLKTMARFVRATQRVVFDNGDTFGAVCLDMHTMTGRPATRPLLCPPSECAFESTREHVRLRNEDYDDVSRDLCEKGSIENDVFVHNVVVRYRRANALLLSLKIGGRGVAAVFRLAFLVPKCTSERETDGRRQPHSRTRSGPFRRSL